MCPRCDADLTRSARYHVQDVPFGEEEASAEESAGPSPSRKAAFLYCAECGRLVAANLLEPDAADDGSAEVAGATAAAEQTETGEGNAEAGEA